MNLRCVVVCRGREDLKNNLVVLLLSDMFVKINFSPGLLSFGMNGSFHAETDRRERL